MSAPVTLHGYYRSSASFRVRIALNLKGLAYRAVPHHLRRGEQNLPDYRRINPQGLVPAMEIDGRVLTQSLAILEYLDETRPEPPLLPKDPAGRARVRALAQIIACDVHPIDNLRVLNYLRGPLGQPDDAVARWYNHWISEGFQALEAALSANGETGRFCHGDTVSLADVCLVPQIINAKTYALDLSLFPTVKRIADTALSLPAFEQALPANQEDAE
ncbi:maleylacetoacetate isomerase [Ensifer sp. Root558]|uniref:maleylacetoacetate isomerase n=1 Tax=Ensifer sp. Root558 TaxID=1736558 RepID=UPI000714932D|nr:maleylacetoacetate isomerase [Ensifer sp. Root558]KQZ58783.1 maleylacetoacetate isomerase [Ensifer sp. Root558]